VIKINLKFSLLKKNLFSSKKLSALLFSVLANIQTPHAASTNDLAEAIASSRRPTTMVSQTLVSTIQHEYAVFKESQNGVATVADFLDLKTKDLTSTSKNLEEKHSIALSIQYILHGHVFKLEPAAPSESQAISLVYARAAILAGAVDGTLDLIPGFSASLTDDSASYHRDLISTVSRKTSGEAVSASPYGEFIEALASAERSNIAKLKPAQREGVSPTGTEAAGPLPFAGRRETQPRVVAVSATDSSDDEGGWCCCFGKKKKKPQASTAINTSMTSVHTAPGKGVRPEDPLLQGNRAAQKYTTMH
jgi:hypothetical protein